MEPIEASDLDLEGRIKRGESIPAPEQMMPPTAMEREMPQEISAGEKDDSYAKILSKVQTSATDETDKNAVALDAEMGAQKTDAESQIQHLIDVAGQKGVVHAVKVARHMQDNYVLDTFHDQLLADELHDALVQKGMIKEI